MYRILHVASWHLRCYSWHTLLVWSRHGQSEFRSTFASNECWRSSACFSHPWSNVHTHHYPTFLRRLRRTTQVPVPIQEAGEATQPRLRIKVESPQFRSVHWYECVAYEDGRLPILLARYTAPDTHTREATYLFQRPGFVVFRSKKCPGGILSILLHLLGGSLPMSQGSLVVCSFYDTRRTLARPSFG